MIENIIVVAAIVLVVGIAAVYVYKARKSGKKCIGCPDGGSCAYGCTCNKNRIR